MQYAIKNSTSIIKQKEECLVVTVNSDKTQSNLIKELDQSTNDMISQLINSGDISGELGKTTFLYVTPNSTKQKILVLSLIHI